ncbi:MAG: family 16 glycosylhydrolase [Melioribacteraceae bacterium]|nr:family 16 glycosylhydrolase [Melioribacteraceae bacterium]
MFYAKRISFLCITILFFSTQNFYSQYYRLAWADEFNGTEINDSNWTHETGGHGWGNAEFQYYTDREDNSYVGNGRLTIKAIKENYGGSAYTSARLISKDKQEFQYGKIEAMIRLPYGQGIWPAFWTLGNDISQVSWPKCGEIDIMEMVGGEGRDNISHGTVHWDDNGHASYGGNYTLSTGNFSEAFHLFSVIWDPQKIQWFVDDKLFNTVDITAAHMDEFHKKHFILLNLAVGGNWPGSPNSSTVFPQTMEIDYVRVYQLSNLYPEINITEPSNNSTFSVHAPINITANVDFEDEIEKVEFYQDAALIGETVVEPYNMNWNNVEAGSYTISAKTYSTTGIVGESEKIHIVVGESVSQSSYKGYYHTIPGVIQLEDYDLGKEGISYSDKDASNTGSTYRNNSVDIEVCEDLGGGYNIGWTQANEWLAYSINVTGTGSYVFTSRVASESSGGSFNIEIDGIDVTGNISINSTGGWQTWKDVVSNEVELTEGNHILKVNISNGNFNFNKINVYEKNAEPEVILLSPNGGEILPVGSILEITWQSQLIDNVRLRYSLNSGSTWKTIVPSTTAQFGIYRWLVPEDISTDCIIAVQDNAKLTTYDLSDNPFEITNITGTSEEDRLPIGFSLEQNYPNPFNPATTIEYSIPIVESKHTSILQLKIYDVLGNEIKTLVNKAQSAGTYKITFDASNLNSGIYFYKLQSGNFVQVKKMSLVK